MIEEAGYLLAKVLSAVFRQRPWRAIGAFVVIILGFLFAMLARAKGTDDAIFFVIALAFTTLIALAYRARLAGQGTVPEDLVVEQTPDAADSLSPSSEDTLAEGGLTTPVQPSTSAKANLPVMAGGVAGVAVIPVLCLAYFVISINLPFIDSGAAMAMGFLTSLVILAAGIVAAAIGAIAGVVIRCVAQPLASESTLIRVARICGATVGVFVAGVAALLMADYVYSS
jgi:hypothetical protein